MTNTPPIVKSKEKFHRQACEESWSVSLMQKWPDDSSFNCSSDSESDGDYYEDHLPTRRVMPAAGVCKTHTVDIPSENSECLESDFDSDSDIDSGYTSLEDPDERANFYNDLLERFRTEGPHVGQPWR